MSYRHASGPKRAPGCPDVPYLNQSGYAKAEIAVLAVGVAIVAICTYFLTATPDVTRVTENAGNFGYIQPKGPDVRLRGGEDIAWTRVYRESTVFQNDRVFTGSSSTARVTLNTNQQLNIEPNSLVVLGDQDGESRIKIDSGSFFSTLGKGARLIVEVRGRMTEINSDGSTVRLESRRSKSVSVTVLKGEADVKTAGVTEITHVKVNEEASVSERAITVEAAGITPVSPAPGATLWDRGVPIVFAWTLDPAPGRGAKIQVSADPLFQTLAFEGRPSGTTIDVKLPPGQTYFWRVIADDDRATRSTTSSFSYYALRSPSVTTVDTLEVETNWRGDPTTPIRFGWDDQSLSESYAFEVAETPDFFKIIYQESTPHLNLSVRGLHLGTYYWRVRSIHPDREDLTSDVVTLNIVRKTDANPRRLASEEPERAPAIPPAAVEPAAPSAPAAPTARTAPAIAPTLEPLARPTFARDETLIEREEPAINRASPAPGASIAPRAMLGWSEVNGADAYVVESSAYPDFRVVATQTEQTAVERVIESPAPGQTFWRVTARRGVEKAVSEVARLRVIVSPPRMDDLRVERDPATGHAELIAGWTASRFANRVEMQIADEDTFARPTKLALDAAVKRLPVNGDGARFARARSIDAHGWPLSRFSEVTSIDVPKLEREVLKLPELAGPERRSFWTRVRAGASFALGAGFASFDQRGYGEIDTGTFAHGALPTYALGADVEFDQRLNVSLNYANLPGKIETSGENSIDQTTYDWQMVSVDLRYQLYRANASTYSVLGGLQGETLPFLSVNPDGSGSLLRSRLQNLVLGVRYDYRLTSRIDLTGTLRYRRTLDGQSLDGYDLSVTPQLTWDGSLGATKTFAGGLRVGVDWFGQSTALKYKFVRADVASSGTQSLFQSVLQLRVGYQFFWIFVTRPIAWRRRRRKSPTRVAH